MVHDDFFFGDLLPLDGVVVQVMIASGGARGAMLFVAMASAVRVVYESRPTMYMHDIWRWLISSMSYFPLVLMKPFLCDRTG